MIPSAILTPLRAAAKRIRISTRTARRTGVRRRIKQLVNLRLLAKVERYISRGFCCRRMIRRSLPLSRGNHLGYSWERGSERGSDSGAAGKGLRALQSMRGLGERYSEREREREGYSGSLIISTISRVYTPRKTHFRRGEASTVLRYRRQSDSD